MYIAPVQPAYYSNRRSDAYPYQASSWPAAQPADPVSAGIAQLGRYVGRDPRNGILQFNRPLLDMLSKTPDRTLPALNRFLTQANEVLPLVEGLYLARELKVRNPQLPMNSTYDVVSKRFNETNNPLIQIYLASLYLYLNEWGSVGPLYRMLMRATQAREAMLRTGQRPPAPYDLDPTEEIGGVLMGLFAKQVAQNLPSR